MGDPAAAEVIANASHVHEAVQLANEVAAAGDAGCAAKKEGSAKGGNTAPAVSEVQDGAGDAPGLEVKVVIEEASTSKPACVSVTSYLRKFRGGLDTRLPVPCLLELLWAWLGAFLGILAVSGANELLFPRMQTTLLVPSFGASAVLVFGVVESKLAQPRNFIGGQLISAVVGLLIRMGLGSVLWLSAPLGMSLALLVMQLTSTTHPPGGATALVAASMKDLAPGHGWMYLAAVAIATLVMQGFALIWNNLSPKRVYPTYWW